MGTPSWGGAAAEEQEEHPAAWGGVLLLLVPGCGLWGQNAADCSGGCGGVGAAGRVISR